MWPSAVGTRRIDLETAVQAFRSLDIEAFRNLIDSAEEAFLRNNLPPKKFREIKRQRAWAALIYTRETGKAAAALPWLLKLRNGVPIQSCSLRAKVPRMRSAFDCRPLGLASNADRHRTAHPLPSRPLPLFIDQYERTAQTLFRLGRFSSGAQRRCRVLGCFDAANKRIG